MNLPKLLLVDDDPLVRRLLSHRLKTLFEVEAVASGEEALAILREPKKFHTVLSDFQLPGLDGIQVLKVVREECPTAVRVLMTGAIHFDAAVDAVNIAGVHRFVAKPCKADEVADALFTAMQQRQTEAMRLAWAAQQEAEEGAQDGAQEGAREGTQPAAAELAGAAAGA